MDKAERGSTMTCAVGQTGDDSSLPAESLYPVLGELPSTLEMSACEVLCWIGYGRAISRERYFQPFIEARGVTDRARAALIHSSVPDPKPAECPMEDAERKLMEALRSGKIHAFVDGNDALETIPTEVFNYAVVVNARGSLEPDQNAAKRDIDRALRYLANLGPGIKASLSRPAQYQRRRRIKEVFFRTSEVREWLTPWPNKVPTIVNRNVASADIPQKEKLPPFDTTKAKRLLLSLRVSKVWSDAPTEPECRAFLLKFFNGVPNDPHRKIRREVWPDNRPGPKTKRSLRRDNAP